MSLLDQIQYRLYSLLTPKQLREAVEQVVSSLAEDSSWTRVSHVDAGTLTEPLTPLARLEAVTASYYYWTRDPLMGRAVQLIRDYTFGQGWQWSSSKSRVQEILDDFKTEDNPVITTGPGQWELSERLQLAGEVFFAFFVNRNSGRVLVRLLEPSEISRVITNPNDNTETWFYERTWRPQTLNDTAQYQVGPQRLDRYPDVRLLKAQYSDTLAKFSTVGDATTQVFVKHIKINSHGRRGVPLYLRALPYVSAYKGLIEDRATLALAAATIAFKQKIVGNKSSLSRMSDIWKQTDFQRRYGAGPNQERAPGAQVMIETEGASLEGFSLNTNSQQAYMDARMIRQMVAAATGVTEPDLTGDPSVSNLASLTSMAGPMYRMFQSWQTLWMGVFTEIANFVVDCKVAANSNIETHAYEDLAKAESRQILIRIPPIIIQDVSAAITSMSSLIEAQANAEYTFVGWDRIAAFILQAMGEADIDKALKDVKSRAPASEKRDSDNANAVPTPEQLKTTLASLSAADFQKVTEAFAELMTAR